MLFRHRQSLLTVSLLESDTVICLHASFSSALSGSGLVCLVRPKISLFRAENAKPRFSSRKRRFGEPHFSSRELGLPNPPCWSGEAGVRQTLASQHPQAAVRHEKGSPSFAGDPLMFVVWDPQSREHHEHQLGHVPGKSLAKPSTGCPK